MVCGSYLRNAIIPAGHIANLARKRVLSAVCQRVHCSNLKLTYESNPKVGKFSASTKMMGETVAPEKRDAAVVIVAPEKRDAAVVILPEKVDDGGFVSGGCKSEDGKLSCGYSSFRGKRANMEDFYDIKMSIVEGKKVCMFGIFDGHGGSRAAEYLKGNLFENLRKHPQFMTDTKLAISETYKKTDMDFLDSEKDTYRDDGSTASTAVLVGSRLYVANVGDSRTVTLKSGRAIPLSEDHKPNRTDERKRIESAGGVVMWAGTWRVGGVLAMSRAFGNRMLKQYVVAEPDIQEVEMNQEFELLVLASDGLWDVVPNEDAVSIARTEEEPVVAARKLTETAFSRGSADNITCIVVRFHHPKSDAEVHNAVEGHLTEKKTGQAVTSHSAKEDVDGGQKVEQSGQNSRDEKGGSEGQKVNQAGSCGKSHEEKRGVNDQQLHEVGQKGENKDHPTNHNASQAGQSCKAGSVDGQHGDKAGPTMAR